MRFKLLLLLLCAPLSGAIYDCFPFYNELELLDVRLHELYDVVDHFVLVESSVTFRGLPKPYLYEENKERFAKFADKIIHVKIGDTGGDAWARENVQRSAVLEGLKGCNARDIIILSDVDEIIPARAVRGFANVLKRDRRKGFAFILKQYEMFLNRVSPDRRFPERHGFFMGSVMLCYDQFIHLTPVGVRAKRIENVFQLVQAGWHFTNMGGFDRVVEKTNNYGFWNMRPKNRERIPYAPDDEARFWRRVEACHLVPIDQTYPKYIVDNLAYFDEIGFIDRSASHTPL